MPRNEYSSLRQGLVGAWCPSLGASGYRLIDRSGKNAHGTLTNMDGQGNWRASGSGVALNFDGTNDYVTGSDRTGLSGNAPYTFSAWVYVTSAAAQGAIVYAGGTTFPLLLRVNTTRSLTINGGPPACSTAAAVVPLAAWAHVAVVYLGTVVIESLVFVNGIQRTITQDSAPNGNVAINWNSANPIQFGARNGPVGFLNGQLDDIRIYNRALTRAEILLLASRRGIGLTPLPDRAAGLPRRFSVNVGGTWREADSYVNVGGVWKLGQPSVNVGGVWK